MSKLEKLRHKMTERWLKLLKAEARHNRDKAKKHEMKLINLELKERELRQHK